jgi:SAM-dependent methyltransferase
MDDTDYALGRTNAEYERLIEQAELLRPLTERVVRAAGIGAGMHVLDIGCGMGDVSFLVAEIVGPEGSVVGVDLDGAVLGLANRRRVARGVTNVVFREGDARSVDPERLFDAAVGRFVLMYMRDPTPALRLVAEKVRPGGTLVFHEWVAEVSPASAMNLPVLASLQNLIGRTFERSGARLDIGAELYRLMRDAGLDPDPRPLAEIAIGNDQGEVVYRRWALFARSMLPKIVEYGLGAEEQVVHKVEGPLRDEMVGARGLIVAHDRPVGAQARSAA